MYDMVLFHSGKTMHIYEFVPMRDESRIVNNVLMVIISGISDFR